MDETGWQGWTRFAPWRFSLSLTHKAVAHVVDAWWPRVMDARDWRCVVVYTGSCLVVAAGFTTGWSGRF
jgi:hypothetical protein